MYNSQKNNLEFSEDVIQEYSDNTVLEVLQQKEDDDNSSKYILIKHDYYASDSDHGRELLRSFFKAINNSRFNNLIIYLVDKGTLLLDKNNPLYDAFCDLITRSEMIIADKESLDFYGVEPDPDSGIVKQSADSIAEDILLIPGILILE